VTTGVLATENVFNKDHPPEARSSWPSAHRRDYGVIGDDTFRHCDDCSIGRRPIDVKVESIVGMQECCDKTIDGRRARKLVREVIMLGGSVRATGCEQEYYTDYRQS
jgi:hypothetical protein